MDDPLIHAVEYVASYYRRSGLAAPGTPLRERLEELVHGGAINLATPSDDPAVLDHVRRLLRDPSAMETLISLLGVVLQEEHRQRELAANQLPSNAHPFDQD